jgi:hypothetical protein
MRSLFLLLPIMLCLPLMGGEGKPVAERAVPEVVRTAAAKALPDARKLGYRLLDQGNYLGQSASGRDSKSVEIQPDGSLVRTSEPVSAPPQAVVKRCEAALSEKKIKGKPRGWRLVTESTTGKKHYETLVSANRSIHEIVVAEDGSAATVSVIETRLDDGSGLRVKVSKGGSIER